jgi:hypothetical protein
MIQILYAHVNKIKIEKKRTQIIRAGKNKGIKKPS